MQLGTEQDVITSNKLQSEAKGKQETAMGARYIICDMGKDYAVDVPVLRNCFPPFV